MLISLDFMRILVYNKKNRKKEGGEDREKGGKAFHGIYGFRSRSRKTSCSESSPKNQI